MSKYTRTAYYVSGGNLCSYFGRWYGGVYKPGEGWANFVVCRTKQNALRQFNKLKVKYRQIDLRVRGEEPKVWRYGK